MAANHVAAIEVNNSGTISGTTTGIRVTATGSLSGGIGNGGTIEGQIGILVSTKSNLAGAGITNSTLGGVVHGAAIGISVVNSSTISGGVHNLGLIDGGTGGQGINLFNKSDISGGVTNAGTIRGGTVAGGSETAIRLFNTSDISGGVHNTGTIQGGPSGFGIRVNTGSDISGGITNAVSGTIAGGTAGVRGSAILVDFSSSISGGIVNNGSIHGGGGYTAIGIYHNSHVASVTNTGTILGSGSGPVAGAAFDISTGSTISGGLTNSGHLLGTWSSLFLRTGADIGGVGIVNQASGLISATNTAAIWLASGGNISGGITNSGTIQGAKQGIHIKSSSMTGAITNKAGGIIRGGTTGILVKVGGDIVGGVNNAGTISGGKTGILSETNADISGGITNSGHIKGVANTAIKISKTSDISGSVHNTGTISGGKYGVYVVTKSDISGGINNGGTIHAVANTAVDVGNTSDISGGVTNTGTIHGGNTGFWIYGHSDISGGIHNTGTISGGNDDAIGVVGLSDISGGVNNGGTINAGTAGFYISNGDISGGVINSGIIHGAKGFDVHANGDVSGGIANSGTILGDATGISVAGAKISGGIINTGTIEGAGGTAIKLAALTGITPITLNGGQIIGDVTDSTAVASDFSPVTVNGTFATDGNFTVSNLTVAAGANLTFSPGNVFTTSRMTTPSSGTFTFGVNAGGAGELVNNVGALDLTVATIAAKIAGAAPVNGSQYLIGDGVTQISGGPAGTLTALASSSFLWGFQIVDGTDNADLLPANQTGNSDLYLLVTQNHTLADATGSGNNAHIGAVLEALSATTTDPQLLAIIDNLNNAPTAQGVNDILSGAGPTIDASDETGSINIADQTLGLTNDRLIALRTGDDETGMAAGNMSKGMGAWGQAFGQHSDQNDRDGIAGYTANTWGGAVGVDTRNVSDHTILGLAFSYGRTDANSENSNSTDTTVDSYQIALYGNWDLQHGYYLNGMGTYGWDSIDRTRHNVGGVTGLTAHGSYDAHQFDVLAEGGRDIPYNGMTLTPNVTAHWVNWAPDSYTETGAGGANLHVDGSTLNKFELGGGVKAGWSFKNGDGSWIKPQLRAGYRYAVTDDQISDTAQFTGGGGAFTVNGANPARSAVDLGASVKFLTTRNWDFTASYDFDWKSDYTASAGFVRVSYKF